MSIFSKLFGKKQAEGEESVRVGGMEDFMTLIRVYYQAVMASNIGITNINFLPDMAVFKRSLKIATQNNKLGVAEKSRCKKMLTDIYGLPDSFFKEVDNSIKKNVKNATFNSVAFMWIRAFILIEIDNNSRLVKKPKSEIYNLIHGK